MMFFRHVPDGSSNLNLLFIWLMLFLGITLAYHYKNNVKALNFVLSLGLLLQLALFLWYLTGETSLFLKEGLPFYHCRMAMVMMAFGVFNHHPKIAHFFAWMGMIGAFIALMIPDPSPYLWPHLTGVTFIFNHIFLAMSGVMILSQDQTSLTYRECVRITLKMNLFLLMINLLIHSNYGYLMALPSLLSLQFSVPFLFISLTLLISFSIFILDTIWNKTLTPLPIKKEGLD